MNVALYLDHLVPKDTYLALASRCIESVRKHMPNAHIIHLTTPEGPRVPEADERIAPDDVRGQFLRRRMTAQSKVQGDTIFCDVDTVFLADVSNVFEMNFDVAVAKSLTPPHPWLACTGGILFSRCPPFFEFMAKFGRHTGWEKEHVGTWVPTQLLFNWLLTTSQFKVHYLPAAIYEYKPKAEDDPCVGARVLHYKGKSRKDWSPEPHMGVLINAPERITPAYKELLKKMHAEQTFGVMGSKWAPIVERLAGQIVTTSILDYGAGPGQMAKALPELPIKEYDIAIEGKDADPDPADLVVCTDMLEHVEPQCVDAVLDHIRSLTARMALLAIYIGPAEKNLPDGRNAHLIQEPPSWWIEKINRRWAILKAECSGNHLVVVANGDKAYTT